MSQEELSRRAVLCGFIGALALAFAPLDRFMKNLARVWAAIFGEPSFPVRRGSLKSYGKVILRVNGQLLTEETGISFQDVMGSTFLATGRIQLADSQALYNGILLNVAEV